MDEGQQGPGSRSTVERMDWIWVVVVALRALSPSPDDVWATRLTALDTVRAQAFAQGDPSLLDDIYVAGSRGRATDAETIAAYASRGGRVEGAALRIVSCSVVAERRDQVRLEVVDQLGRASVVWADGSTTSLPHDQPSRRHVVLERTSAGWRIVSARQTTPR